MTRVAGSQIDFQIRKADATIRHTVTTSHATAQLKNPTPSYSSPLRRRGEDRSSARREPYFLSFLCISLHARSSLSIFCVSRATHTGRLFAQRSPDFFSLSLTISFCYFFDTCLRIRVPSRRVDRRGRHEGTLLPLRPARSLWPPPQNHEVPLQKRMAQVRQEGEERGKNKSTVSVAGRTTELQ